MVFEKVVGQLLARVLGDYLEGLNQNISLGLWQGELSLQNVKVKKDLLKNLGLPIDISFSAVEELRLKIPWKSIQSSKIEINLSGLYLIADVLPEGEWIVPTLKDNLEKRKTDIENYTQELIKSLLKKKASKGKEADGLGFTQKLVLRIIDNLQITVSNIHVRLQAQEGYAAGITLESIKLVTVNKKGEDQYIDRTKQENKKEPLRKKLYLKNLGVYWDTYSKNLCEKGSLEKGVIASLNYMIHRGDEKPLDKKYILFISSDANLFQREKGQQFELPELHFQINVHQFRIELENKQLQQAISLSELAKHYTEKRKPKASVNLSSSSKTDSKQLQQFKEIYQHYYNSSHMSQEQTERYNKIVAKIDPIELFPIIKEVVKESEKKRMLDEKSVKKTGWFSWSKKELTTEEIEEVEAFLSDSLITESEEEKVTRPKAYFFLRVDLHAFESEITIGKSDVHLKRGISILSTNLETTFLLREEGFRVHFGMSDLALNLFTKKGMHVVNTALYTKSEYFKEQKYIEAVLESKPVDKPYVDTELKVVVRPGVLTFNPLVISRIRQFTRVKVNEDTSEMAIQTYSNVKQKAAKSLQSQISNKKMNICNVDIQVLAPLIIIPFQANSEKDCWAISMTELRILTDPKMLNPAVDKTSETYRLQLKNVWMSSYKYRGQVLEMSLGSVRPEGMESIVSNFTLAVSLELERRKDDISKADMSLSIEMSTLNLNLGTGSYKSLCNMGAAFIQPGQEYMPQEDPIEMIKSQKQQILSHSEKVGIIHKRNIHSMFWSKYIAVLSGNYIYLYADKKDLIYESFVYVKNSKLMDESRQETGRDYTLRIVNKVSEELLSFDNSKSIQEWRELIQSPKHQTAEFEEETSSAEDLAESKKKDSEKKREVLHMKLKTRIDLKLQAVNLYIHDFMPEKPWVSVTLQEVNFLLKKYECYTDINITLGSLELVDNVENFKNVELQYLLMPKKVGGVANNLLSIRVIQAQHGDPRYQNIDNHVSVEFGVLVLNWKPNSINKLMRFFFSKPESSPQQPKKLEESDLQVLSTTSTIHVSQKVINDRLSLKLEMRIQSILVNLVNKYNRVKQGSIDFKGLNLCYEVDLNCTSIRVNAEDLIVSDCENYPNTIVAELEYFPNHFPLLKTRNDSSKGIVEVKVIVLQKPNEEGKDLLIHITFYEITIDLILEPFLRTIGFISNQLIPSLSTSNPNPSPPPSTLPVKPSAPTPSKLQLMVSAIDSSILLKPNPSSDEMLELRIPKVVVRNHSTFREYTTSHQKVLVSMYSINVTDLQINKGHEHLTNNFNLAVNLEFIDNERFYWQRFGESLLGGSRVLLTLSPIVLRLSNSHFRFIMRCINWNITYSDNCQKILYPPQKTPEAPPAQLISIPQDTPPSYPLYLNVEMQLLTVAVTDMGVPISNIALNIVSINVEIPDKGVKLRVSVNTIMGSYFVYIDDRYIEKGMVGMLAHYGEHTYQQLRDLKELVRLFNKQDQYRNEKNDLVLLLTEADGDTQIDLTLERCTLNLQLKHLLKISRLFSLEGLEDPPTPRFKFLIVESKTKQFKKKSNSLKIHSNELIVSTGDQQHEEIKILGQIHVAMLNKEERTREDNLNILKRDPDGEIPFGNLNIEVSNLELFLTYKPKKGVARKRTLLNPVTITIEGSNSYTIMKGKLCVSNKYGVRINSLTIEATISDSVRFQNIIDTNRTIIEEFNETNRPRKKTHKIEVQLVQAILLPEEERPLDNTLITRIDFGDTEILLINDANNMFVPIIKFSIHSIKPSSYIIPSKTELHLITVLEASFFNPRSARWEPVLQKTTLNFKTESNKAVGDHNEAIVELEVEESINLNLSSQLLISLLVSVEFGKQVKQMLKERQQHHCSLLIEENGLQLPSPYTVQNMTKTQFKIILTDSALKKLKYDNRPEARQYIQKHKETIIPAKYKGYIFIPSEADEVDVAIGQERYTVKLNRYLKHRIGKSRFLFSCKVQNLTRVIKITGETTLTNMLQVPLYVNFGETDLKVGAGVRIPLEGVEELRISRVKGFLSDLIRIKDLQRHNTTQCKQLNQYLTIVNNSYEINDLLYRSLVVRPPLKLINCLPKPLIFQLYEENMESSSTLVPSQEEFEVHSYSSLDKLHLKLYVPGFHWAKPFPLVSNVNKEFDLVLRDIDLNFAVIKILVLQNEVSESLSIHIYSPGYIINDTPFDLTFYVSPSSENKKERKHFKPLAGQKRVHPLENIDDTIVLLGADAGNEFKITDKKEDTNWISNEVGLVSVSEVQVEVIREHNGEEGVFFVSLAIDVNLKQMHKHSDVLSKQVRLKPKYILHNMARRIHWRQLDTKQWFTLEAGEKEILYLLSKKEEDIELIVKTDTSSESAFLVVSGLGEVHFAVEEKGNPVYMKIDNTAANGHVIMTISEVAECDLPYQFHNKLNQTVVVRLIGFNRDIYPTEKTSFVWSDPNDERNLMLTIISEDEPVCSLKVCPDQVNEVKQLTINRHGQPVKLKVFVTVEKDKRVVVIDEEEDIVEREVKLSTTKILLKDVGISIIMNHQGVSHTFESFFISMKYLEFFYEKTTYYEVIQFRLRFLQVDQNSPEFIKHPVMLTPQRFNYFNKMGDDHLINILMKRDVRLQSQTIIKQILLEVKDLSVRVSEESVHMIFGLRAEVIKIMDPKKEFFKVERKANEWRKTLVPQSNHKVYIEHIAISPLIIKLTASTSFGTSSDKSVNRQQELMGRFFTAFGVAFANIEDALVIFKGINLENIFDTPSGIQDKLIIHYKSTAFNEVYKVFGSLTVLGDPRGLFLNITTGLKDMVSKPAEGLVRGPLQLGKGLASGAQSLYSNVMGGVLGSATKIIRSISTGINILTFDEKYIHENLVMQSSRVDGIVQGVKKGVRILFFAFKDTVLGVIVKPVRGAQRQGVLGFMIGGMTALAGIVIKPVTGVLDFLWIILDSIKNTIVFQQDIANEFRIRQPRVFYGPNSTLQSYSQLDANSMLLLRQKNLLGEGVIMQTFQLSYNQVLVILDTRVLVVKPNQREVVWSIDIRNIGSVSKTHRGVEVKSKVIGNDKQLVLLADTTNVTREEKEEIRETIESTIHDNRDE